MEASAAQAHVIPHNHHLRQFSVSKFKNIESIGDKVNVPIPTDENGMLGRECPTEDCLGYFKLKPGTGLTGPGLKCHCPYCGHSGNPDTFSTKEQIEYAKSVVFRQFTEAVRKDLKQFEFDRPAKGAFGIGFSMKLLPGNLPPIRHYREQQLETDVVCDNCTLQYSVFGAFAFCPDCKIHNSFQILQQNLELVEKQISLADTLDDADFRRHLIEDALENCVSAFDGFGRETCRVRAHLSSKPDAAQSVSFQNLEKAHQQLAKLFPIDFKASVDPEIWRTTERGFFKRHLVSHRSGIVDEAYMNQSGDASAKVGRRIAISSDEVRELAAAVVALGGALVTIIPKS